MTHSSAPGLMSDTRRLRVLLNNMRAGERCTISRDQIADLPAGGHPFDPTPGWAWMLNGVFGSAMPDCWTFEEDIETGNVTCIKHKE